MRRKYGREQDAKNFAVLVTGLIVIVSVCWTLPQLGSEAFFVLERLVIVGYLLISGVIVWRNLKESS